MESNELNQKPNILLPQVDTPVSEVPLTNEQKIEYLSKLIEEADKKVEEKVLSKKLVK